MVLGLALALAACSGGEVSGGDSVPQQQPSVIGNGYTLAQLNDPASKFYDPPANKDLVITGVSVVAVDQFDETQDGKSIGNIYVEDLAQRESDGTLKNCADITCPYSGMTLYGSAFSPPDLTVAAGDVVDIHGRYDAFAGPTSSPFDSGEILPEISGGTVSLRFEYTPAAPVTIDIHDLTSYATGRKWIGMLVKIDNAKLADTASPSPGTRLSVPLNVGGGVKVKDVPSLSNSLFDLGSSGLPLNQGQVYKSIVGVVEWFYNFTLCPRSAADLTL
jgi:hypothetical protein